MPIVDGQLVPRTPLTPAELHVNYLELHQHIETRRAATERACKPAVNRVVAGVVDLGNPSPAALAALRARLEQTLTATARLGYRTARAEISSLRLEPVTAEHAIPDAGDHARSGSSWETLLSLIRRRAHQTAAAITDAATAAPTIADEALTRTAVLAAATRALHNHVLELVGETLNLGRSLGATSLNQPPEFAMRSEQLDKATCSACDRLHGTIVAVGSADYFSYMPPAGCYGGGRCRGVWIYADDREQVRGPDTSPGLQPSLPDLRPIQNPTRRAA